MSGPESTPPAGGRTPDDDAQRPATPDVPSTPPAGEVKDYRASWKRAVARRRPSQATRRRAGVRFTIALAAVATLAWAADFAYEPPPTTEPLPASLVGVWRTSDPLYEGRRFVLQPDSVFIQVGREASMLLGYRIMRFSRSSAPEGELYRLTYREDEDDPSPMLFSFYYRAGDSPSIVLAGQTKILWRRDPAPGSASP